MRDRLLLIGAALVIAAGLSGGCTKPQPHVEPELPPLNAPPPPPRLLPPLAGGPIEGAATTPPPDAGPARPRRRPETPRPAEREESKPPEAASPEPEPAAPAEAAPLAPAPVLQLAPATESKPSEQAIRQQLANASRDLGHVDYGALSADAKTQYDTAKRFTVLSEQAIKDRNFVFARTLADKAAVIAAVLLSH